jgi:hypothetical protein
MAENYLYLYIFIAICVAIIGWSMIRLERVYQYPFFMAAIFMSFIVPQANALVNSNSSIVLSQEVIGKVLLYSCLCAAMCWIGYKLYQPNPKWLAKLDIPLDENKLLRTGFILLSVGYICYSILPSLAVETGANGNLTGPATILLFFGGVIFIAFPIFLLAAIKQPKFINIALAILAALPIIQSVLGGRRQPTIVFLLTIGMVFFLVKNYIPPRWFFLVFIVMAALIIPVLGNLRGDFWTLIFNGDWQSLADSTQANFDKLNRGEILELRNAALMIDGADKTNTFGFGTGWWDSVIFQYIPGQIVGFDVKKSFQFGISVDLQAVYGYNIPNGSTATGMGDSYNQFSYLGCLVFALIGCIFKTLWTSLVYRQSIVSSLLYIGLMGPAMVGITHGIGRFLQEFIFQVVVMYLIVRFSRESSRLSASSSKKFIN